MIYKENEMKHKLELNDKQIEFLTKCIDISTSVQRIKPDMSEVEIIRTLTLLNEEIQELKLGDRIYNDLQSK
tara:strand:+ start:1094 stop:1309 length:216 start_codon:yes stop_codon:yes gene_type:complete